MFMEPLKSEMGEGNFGVASVGSIQVRFKKVTLSFLFCFMMTGGRLPGKRPRGGEPGHEARGAAGLRDRLPGVLARAADRQLHQLCHADSRHLQPRHRAGLRHDVHPRGGGSPGEVLSLQHSPLSTLAQAHFTRRRALATGIAVCGTGVGTLVLPPLVETLIAGLGWRGAMRALSCLCLASVACGAAMSPAPRASSQEAESQEARSEESGDRKELRGIRWLLSHVVGEDLASSPTLLLFFTIMTGEL